MNIIATIENRKPGKAALALSLLFTASLVQAGTQLPHPSFYKSQGQSGELFPEMRFGEPENFAHRKAGKEVKAQYKIEIKTQGLYRIRYSKFVSLGLSPSTLIGREIRLFNQNEEIAVYRSTQEMFTANDYIVFYAEPFNGVHSDKNVYWLGFGGKGLNMEEVSAEPIPNLEALHSSPAIAHHYKPKHWISDFRPHDESIDHWFSELLISTRPETIPLTLQNIEPDQDATLHLKLIRKDSRAVFDPMHKVRISVNGQANGNLDFNGNGTEWHNIHISADKIKNGINQIELHMQRSGSSTIIGFLKEAAISYTRRLVAKNGTLTFNGQRGLSNYSLRGFEHSKVWVINNTDSAAPQLMTGPQAVEINGSYQKSIGVYAADKDSYFIADNTALLNPVNITKVKKVPNLANTNLQADYLIITSAHFKKEAQRLLNRRISQGLSGKIILIDDIYNQFSYGIKTPEAIRQFLGYAYHHWQAPQPRYVTLIGDATYDPRNYKGANHSDFVPAYFGKGSFNYTSQDNRLACVDENDDLIDICISRIPVNSNYKLRQYIDKVQHFENRSADNPIRKKVSWVTDNRDGGGDFKARSNYMRAVYFNRNGFVSDSSHLDQLPGATVRNRLLDAFAQGRYAIDYMGHGLGQFWAEYGNGTKHVLAYSDTAKLRNKHTPVVTAWACETGNFHDAKESLMEGLIESEYGAVATISSSSEAFEIISAQIAENYFHQLTNKKRYRIGDALMSGFENLHAYNSTSPELLFYHLFGDAALTMQKIKNVNADSDRDGMKDGWESRHGLEPFIADGHLDLDNDALTNLEEYRLNTNPRAADSDADGFDDAWERNAGTNPNRKSNSFAFQPPPAADTGSRTAENLDSDSDGLNDADEHYWGSLINNPDTDGDGLTDGNEVHVHKTNPASEDSDQDGLNDYDEVVIHSTNPRLKDTDNDHMPDAWEITHSLNPKAKDQQLDPDNDLLINILEFAAKTDPQNPDSDGDGLTDHYEINHSKTNPNRSDSDGDNLSDGDEVLTHHSNPNRHDSDSDGLDDDIELSEGTNVNLSDSDNDGMPDEWEWAQGLNPNSAADRLLDFDDDGLHNLSEYYIGTQADNPDSDNDLLLDGEEIHLYGTDPLKRDTDFDYLTDYDEVVTFNTDPDNPDSDGDTLLDGWETAYGFNPNNPVERTQDPDNDGLNNLLEQLQFSHPLIWDTDGDGLSDNYEYRNGLPPRLNDRDFDGLLDGVEIYTTNTDPFNADTDGDRLSDGDEVNIYNSNPLKRDTDNDGMNDLYEARNGLNPRFKDHLLDLDGDGLSNEKEYKSRTKANDSDTDDDLLSDRLELLVYKTNPRKQDSDRDGINDYDEVMTYRSNPNKRDSDGDRMPDGYEISVRLNVRVANASGDPDGDLIPNYQEMLLGTNPKEADTDGDSLSDSEEVFRKTNPLLKDSDGDGMDDHYEVLYGLNPRINDANRDLDLDGLSNMDEFNQGSNPREFNSGGAGAYNTANLTPDILMQLSFSLGVPTISWESEAGKSYRLIETEHLTEGESGQRIVLENIPATPPVNTLEITDELKHCNIYFIQEEE